MKIIFKKFKKNNNKIKDQQEKKQLIKDKIKRILVKIKNKDNKLAYKHYSLLILMVLIGMLSLRLNIKKNNKLDDEEYTTHVLETNTKVKKENIDYKTAVSSISTDVMNISDNINKKQDNNRKQETKYIMPVNGEISKRYSKEELILSDTLGMWMTHNGIDIEANEGTAVVAIQEGIVESIYQDALYGNTIIINHDNGYASIYCNLEENILVQKEQKVKQGDTIGKVGKTAIIEIEDNPHIHLEILKDGVNINPADIGLK